MTTEQYQIGYEDGYSDGFDEGVKPASNPIGVPPLFNDLPEGTTHISKPSVCILSGGRIEMEFYCFKFATDGLRVFRTDSDNEYPAWVGAERCYKILPDISKLIPVTGK